MTAGGKLRELPTLIPPTVGSAGCSRQTSAQSEATDRKTLLIGLAMKPRWVVLMGFFIVPFLCLPALARDLGQWENSDPTIRAWFKGLMRPDMPTSSCCGEADAYWADEVHVRDGRVFATITDDREDGPLRRPHVPVGTEIEVPPNKIKWDRGNPTGHNIIFLASYGKFVFCFVQGSGT